MVARIQAPASARRGEVITVRILIGHPMESGFRRDDTGHKIPYDVIETLSCRYLGDEVFGATMSSGIAANPLLQFHLVARASGSLDFSWRDTAGQAGSASHALTVSD